MVPSIVLTFATVWVVGAAVPTPCPCLHHCEDAEDPPFYHQNGDSCLRLFRDVKNWVTAQAQCKLDGGKLAEPDTQEKMDFVASSVPATQLYVWVGGMYDTNSSKWRWTHSRQQIAPELWGSQGECAFVSRLDTNVALFRYSCEEQMPFLCEKPTVVFTPRVYTPTVAAAMGKAAGAPPYAVVLAREGAGSLGELRAVVRSEGCAGFVAAGDLTPVQDNGTWVVPNPLTPNTTYTVCWFGPVLSDPPAMVPVSASSVTITVPPLPHLPHQHYTVPSVSQANPQAVTVSLHGTSLTNDVWLALHTSPDCSGTPAASPAVVQSGGAFTLPPVLPLSIPLTGCLATWDSSSPPPLEALKATALRVTVLPPPVFDTAGVAITHAEALSGGTTVTLHGTHLEQSIWVRLHTHPWCLGSAVGGAVRTVVHSATNISFPLPNVPAGQPLHLCHAIGNTVPSHQFAATNVTITVTPSPRFDPDPSTGMKVVQKFSFAEDANASIGGRHLHTAGRPSMLWAVILSGGSCSMASAPFPPVPLHGSSPLAATASLPRGMSGRHELCVAAGLSPPTATGDWLAVYPTAVVVVIPQPPSFAPTEYWVGSPGTTVTIAGDNLTPSHIWLAFASSPACTTTLSTPIPATGGTVGGLLVPSDAVFNAVPSLPFTAFLCWQASVAPPSTWNTSGVVLHVLPPPAVLPYLPTLLVQSAPPLPKTVTVQGTGLQRGQWGVVASGEKCSGEGHSGGALECVPKENYTCSVGEVPLPPLTTPGMYTVCLTSSPNATSSAEGTDFTGIHIEVLAAPRFDQQKVVVGVVKWSVGFSATLTGRNIGGLSVTVCSSPSQHTVLGGPRNASNSSIAFPPHDPRLKPGEVASLCVDGEPTGVEVHILDYPTLLNTTYHPTVAQLGSYLRVDGENLGQPGVLAALCEGKTCGEVLPVVNHSLLVPKALIHSSPGKTLTLHIGVNPLELVTTPAAVVIPHMPTFPPQALRPGWSLTTPLTITGTHLTAHMWVSLTCSTDPVRLAPLNSTHATFTPLRPSPNIVYRLCVTYSLSTPQNSAGWYPSSISVEWGSPPDFPTSNITLRTVSLLRPSPTLSLPFPVDGIWGTLAVDCSTWESSGFAPQKVVEKSLPLSPPSHFPPTTYHLCVSDDKETWYTTNITATIPSPPNVVAITGNPSAVELLKGTAPPYRIEGTGLEEGMVVILHSSQSCSSPSLAPALPLKVDSPTAALVAVNATLGMLLYHQANGRAGLCWGVQDGNVTYPTGLTLSLPRPPEFESKMVTTVVRALGGEKMLIARERLFGVTVWGGGEPVEVVFENGGSYAVLPVAPVFEWVVSDGLQNLTAPRRLDLRMDGIPNITWYNTSATTGGRVAVGGENLEAREGVTAGVLLSICGKPETSTPPSAFVAPTVPGVYHVCMALVGGGAAHEVFSITVNRDCGVLSAVGEAVKDRCWYSKAVHCLGEKECMAAYHACLAAIAPSDCFTVTPHYSDLMEMVLAIHLDDFDSDAFAAAIAAQAYVLPRNVHLVKVAAASLSVLFRLELPDVPLAYVTRLRQNLAVSQSLGLWPIVSFNGTTPPPTPTTPTSPPPTTPPPILPATPSPTHTAKDVSPDSDGPPALLLPILGAVAFAGLALLLCVVWRLRRSSQLPCVSADDDQPKVSVCDLVGHPSFDSTEVNTATATATASSTPCTAPANQVPPPPQTVPNVAGPPAVPSIIFERGSSSGVGSCGRDAVSTSEGGVATAHSRGLLSTQEGQPPRQVSVTASSRPSLTRYPSRGSLSRRSSFPPEDIEVYRTGHDRPPPLELELSPQPARPVKREPPKPWPPPASALPRCSVCGHEWEGGRYCGMCGTVFALGSPRPVANSP